MARRYKYQDVKEIVESFDFKLLSSPEEIVNDKGFVLVRTVIRVQCPNEEHEIERTLSSIKSYGLRCRRCNGEEEEEEFIEEPIEKVEHKEVKKEKHVEKEEPIEEKQEEKLVDEVKEIKKEESKEETKKIDGIIDLSLKKINKRYIDLKMVNFKDRK